jgi:hypothetical protein
MPAGVNKTHFHVLGFLPEDKWGRSTSPRILATTKTHEEAEVKKVAAPPMYHGLGHPQAWVEIRIIECCCREEGSSGS